MGVFQSKKKQLYLDLVDDRKVKNLWHRLDKGNKSVLSTDELQEGLRKMKYSESSINELLNAIKAKHGNTVTFSDFSLYISTKRAQLRSAFEALDHKHDGALDKEEVQKFMREMNLTYDEESVQKLFGKMDTNKDGRIQFDEWQALLLLAPQTEADALFRYWGDTLARDIDDEDWELAREMRSYRQVVLQGVAGAGAGMLSRTATAPLERLKILYQVHVGKPEHNLMRSFLNIYKDGGLSAYFRGNGANVLKVAPESAIKFTTFEAAKRFFAEDDQDVTPAERALSGAIAGVTTHTSMFPLEVIKTRLAAAPRGYYKGIGDCIRQTAVAEGRFLPFYRGLSASLLSTIPHASVELGAYETFKQATIKWHGSDLPLPTVYLMACAGAASTLSQAIAYPFHLVKTRYIAQGSGGRPRIYTGLFDVFRKTFAAEGVPGFYRGIVPSFMKSVPAHMVTYTVYDYFKRVFGIEKKHKGH